MNKKEEEKLMSVFEKHKKTYQIVYSKDVGLSAKAENTKHFNKINNEFIKKI